jgi:hypothetical protein
VFSFLPDSARNGWPRQTLLLIDIINAEGYPSTACAVRENRLGQLVMRWQTGGTRTMSDGRNRPARTLQRVAFKTSRLAEFCSTRERVAQTGHAIAEWPLVILKELTDNAIDICEEKDIAPEIAVSVSTEEGTITVADYGPGIPPQTVIDVLDYSVRVSSREA